MGLGNYIGLMSMPHLGQCPGPLLQTPQSGQQARSGTVWRYISTLQLGHLGSDAPRLAPPALAGRVPPLVVVVLDLGRDGRAGGGFGGEALLGEKLELHGGVPGLDD